MKKNPTFLKPQEGLTDTQRKVLNLPRVAPRKRLPGEALPIQFCNASASGTYRTGQGETVAPLRPGATNALNIKSRGFSC